MFPSHRMARDERKRQLVTGVSIIAGMGLLGLLLVIGTGLPGFAGVIFTKIAGIMITPFLLEATMIIFGAFLVMIINGWRQHREGDELVYLDELGAGTRSEKAVETHEKVGAVSASPPPEKHGSAPFS